MPASDASPPGNLRIYKYLIPVLLASLAVLQLFLGQTANMTPWKGGGYGMFSTVDGPSARVVRVYLETAGGEIPIRMPSWIRNQEKYAISLPAAFRLQSIAEEIANASWHYVPGKGYAADGSRIAVVAEPVADAAVADPTDPDGDEAEAKRDKPPAYPPVSSRKPGKATRDDRVQVALTGVRLEVWRRLYHRTSDSLSLEKIAQVRVEVPR